MKEYKVGSVVQVKLFNGTVLEGTVKAIHETVAGRRVSIHSGFMALKLRAEQIIKVVR